MVRRSPDPDDARATLLSLTEPGQRAVDVTRDRLARRFDQHLAVWPE
ncbi:hypothetical protein [Nocardia sp. NPDC055049]